MFDGVEVLTRALCGVNERTEPNPELHGDLSQTMTNRVTKK